MRYRLDCLPREPIILGIFGAEYNIRRDTPLFNREMADLLTKADRPTYFICDMLNMRLNFSDMVAGLAMVAAGEIAVMRHPRLARTMVVSGMDLVRFGARAMTQTQYGKLKVSIFDTVYDAHETIRAELAQERVLPR
jgi:hypothetical protein